MRHILGLSQSGPTIFRNVRRHETGEPLLLIDQDAVTKLRIDCSDWLESGETISSATVTAEQCTVSTVTASPNITLTISNVSSHSGGSITVVATSSTGEKWRGIIRVRRTSRYKDERSFADYV